MYDIIVGRNDSDRKLFGDRGVIFLGRQYIKMGQTTALSNNVYMDVARSHVVLVSGKRGSGKSYSLSVMAEEMANLPKDVKENLSVLLFDTTGVFWTMKYPNTRQEKLLREWKSEPRGLDIKIFTPTGYYKEYKKKDIPTDHPFSIKPSELNSGDWCNVFEVSLNEPIGILIERIIGDLQDTKKEYDLKEIIDLIKKDKKSKQEVKDAAENRFLAAQRWGLFDKEGTKIKDLVKRGEVSVLDVSCYSNTSGEWGIKNLVIGLVTKKLFVERMETKKLEERESIKHGSGFFTGSVLEGKKDMPVVWVFLDEAHECLPKEGKTPASNALMQVIREGRQPGLSLVLATQQPGEIHRDVITQSDIVLSHRVTAKYDVEALNVIMQSYLTKDIQRYLNDLPRLKGSAIILDDNSERIYPMRVKPKLSWHGGEEPSAVHKLKSEIEL